MATSINKQIAKNKRNTVFIMIIFIAIVSAIGALFVWLTGDERLLGIFMIIATVYAGVQYFLTNLLSFRPAQSQSRKMIIRAIMK